MSETWLRVNRRPYRVGLVLLGICGLLGLWLLSSSSGDGPAPQWRRPAGMFLAAAACIGGTVLLAGERRPRLAHEAGSLLVYLGGAGPEKVPLEHVEAFLLGQGPSQLPGRHSQLETKNLVIRLADRATSWRQRPANPRLGTWCDGYITLRGTWCEPLSVETVGRLNEKLAGAKELAAGRSET